MIFLAMFASLVFLQQPVHALPAFKPPISDIKCSQRVSQSEHHVEVTNAVLSGDEDVSAEEVAIRGEDNRKLDKKFAASMKLVCETQDQQRMDVGTANLVDKSMVATVMHNVVNPADGCRPLFNMKKCGISNNGKLVPIEGWVGDLVQICKEASRKGIGDKIIVGVLESPIENIQPYTVLCGKSLKKADIKNLKVASALATNSKLKVKSGKNAIVSNGEVYRRSGNVINYSHDTGKGTSGGALVANLGEQDYFVGIHRGDASVTQDGEEASPDDNFGVGTLIDADEFGLECKDLDEKASQDET